VRQGSGIEGDEQSLRRRAELGRLLAAAALPAVARHHPVPLGKWHAAVSGAGPVGERRFRRDPFSAIETVRARERTVVLRVDRGALEHASAA
jgi:hypothetical protein